MRFITSIITLATMAGALMLLYVGAGSLLKVNRSSAEDQLLAAQRAAGVIARIAQNSGPTARPGLAAPSVTGRGSDLADRSNGYGTGVPQPLVVQPSPWAQPPFPVFPDPVPWVPRFIPRSTPSPADEALAVYRKYAAPQ